MGLKDFLFNNDYSFLLQIAIILLSTKLLGLLTKRISLPQVVGALAAGIVLGPMVLNVVQRNDLIVSLAELGVIVLMFSAGLETDIQELKKAGLASFVIALLGVIVPLVGGFFLADFYNTEQNPEMAKLFWQNIFIGVVLTATSVSITVETLKELGALNSRAGNAILGAAVIDDILGIIALTVVISLGGKKSGDGEAEKTFGSLLAGDGVLAVVINILAFFIVAIGAAVLYHFFFKKWRESSNENLRRHNIVTFVFCLLLSFVAEICFGVADITGAFVAGLAVSGLKKNEYVVNRFNTLSYMLLSPIFFANIGLAMTLKGLTKKLVIFMLLLMLLAVVTKVIGCGLGAKIMRYTNKESLQIGIGMISRGEVALIVANKGASVGLMSEKFMTPLVIMVVFTTIVTPILLKLVFPKKKGGDKETVSDDLTALEKHAQFEKGKWFVNPSVTGLNFSYNTETDKAHFGLEAKGGAFLVDNVALLIDAGAKWQGGGTDVYTLGVGGRYYISKVGVFLGAGVDLNRYDWDGGDKTRFGFGMEAGYAFFLSRTVTIEPAVYWDIDKDRSEFGLKVGFGFYF